MTQRVTIKEFLAVSAGGALVLTMLFVLAERADPKLSEFLTRFAESFYYFICYGGLFTLSAGWIERQFAGLAPAGQWAGWGAATLVLSAAGTLLATALRMLWDLPTDYFGAALRQSYPVGTVISAVMVFGTRAIALQERRAEEAEAEKRAAEARTEAATRLAAESQLASLQSRVHPHFLFNTLNSVIELVRADPSRAIRTLERLSHLFRYSLDREQQPLAPLGDEIRIARDYLEIESIRLGGRLSYSFDVSDEVARALAPRLGVEILVENAVKYAISSRRGGGSVSISAISEGGNLVIAVTDDGPGFSESSLKAGHALANLRGRVSALYGANGRLEIIPANPGATVRLITPLRMETAQDVA